MVLPVKHVILAARKNQGLIPMNSLVTVLSSLTIYPSLLSGNFIQASILPTTAFSFCNIVHWEVNEESEQRWACSRVPDARLYVEYRTIIASVELYGDGTEASINLEGSASRVNAIVFDHLEGGLLDYPYTVDSTFPVREGTSILLGVSKTIDTDIKDCLKSLAEIIDQGVPIEQIVISEFTDCQMCAVVHGQVSRACEVTNHSGLKRKAIDTPDMASTETIIEMLQRTTSMLQENLGPLDQSAKSSLAKAEANPSMENGNAIVQEDKIIERSGSTKSSTFVADNNDDESLDMTIQMPDPRRKMSIKSLLN